MTLKCSIDRDILGLTPEDAKEWQRRTEREFEIWAGKRTACDATGMNNFAGMQQLALVSWLMSGDCFVLFKRRKPTVSNPYSLRLHLIEADRVSTPEQSYGVAPAGIPFYNITDGKNRENGNRIYDGVEVDASGLAVAYHIRNTYPYQLSYEKTDWQRVEACGGRTGLPNILHIMSSERPDQYRGVTYLAQVVEPLLQLRRYTDSALMMALVQSFFTAWIKTNTDPNDIPINEVGGGNIAGDVPANNPREDNISDSENEYEMGPGLVTHLEQDEDIVFGNPQIPTAGFDAFVRTFCELVGAALEIALQNAKIAETDAEINGVYRTKDEDGEPVYEVSFRSGDLSYDYVIGAYDGEIAGWKISGFTFSDTATFAADFAGNDRSEAETAAAAELSAETVSAALIGEDNAREIAYNDAAVKPAEVLHAETELREEADAAVYTVTFRTASRQFRYEIDAHSGAVLDSEAVK